MTTIFTQEEIAIMAMYRTDTKKHLVTDLTEAAPHIDDSQVQEHVQSILQKLNNTNAEAFAQISFMPDYL